MSVAARQAALLAWYRGSHRDLPWRRTDDPYAVLVSEVMLQQTQVDRVVPRYERFLRRFPNVAALATAPLADVLDEWSGLGYNSRAKRLHDAARCVDRDGWPAHASGLRELPGIGPYTAAAVASFAFGERVGAVDTNVRRVLSRWSGRALAGRELEAAAADELPEDAATWNQAVMELGAVLCRPRSPRCADCPVEVWCADPTVYEPPPPQAPFEGSRRQLRGAVLRALRSGPKPFDDLRGLTNGHSIEDVLTDLTREGLIEETDGTWALPKGIDA
ncbi:MAG TPA: A/G-specific adenine glycosylase [Acidimicrobiia bacterium]|nr:A/G-specific adenine glycosylase [Acidimicrobiia bacterium]